MNKLMSPMSSFRTSCLCHGWTFRVVLWIGKDTILRNIHFDSKKHNIKHTENIVMAEYVPSKSTIGRWIQSVHWDGPWSYRGQHVQDNFPVGSIPLTWKRMCLNFSCHHQLSWGRGIGSPNKQVWTGLQWSPPDVTRRWVGPQVWCPLEERG